MNRAILIGCVVAAVLLAAIGVAPRFLRSATSISQLDAMRQAEQARRELGGYVPALSAMALRADLASLKGADLSKLSESAATQLPLLSEQARKDAQTAGATDRQFHLPNHPPTPPSGLPGAVSQVEQFVKDNDALLKKAAADAQAALSAGGNAPGVAHVAGMVKLVEAHAHWTEALRLRSELESIERRALEVAGAWNLNRSEGDYYHGLDPSKMLAGLAVDVDELRKLAQDATSEVEALGKQVAERQTALEQARTELKAARADQLALEEKGFTPGNDQSLATFQTQYEAVSQKVGQLQTREQLLASGGTEGGNFADDDALEGKLTGGSEVEGLDRLEARLAEAKVRAERLALGVKALEQGRTVAEVQGRDAKAAEQRYAGNGERIQADFKKVQAELETTFAQAAAQEEQALVAARAAAEAFGRSRAAVDTWVNEARTAQQTLDTAGKNERLRKIAGDDMAAAFSEAAEAEARTLIGRIHAERFFALTQYTATLQSLTQLVQGSSFNVEDLQKNTTLAHDEAIAALTQAHTLYGKVAQKSTWAQWPQQISLGTVDYLLSKLDTVNAQQHLADATDNLKKAIAKREKYPLVNADAVLLARQLGALNVAPEGDAASQPAGGNTPSGG